MFLQRGVIALLVGVAGLVGRRQIARVRHDRLQIAMFGRNLVFEHFVDADDQLRDRPEPRKLRIFQQRIKQRIARLPAMDALVGRALPIEQRFVQTQQRMTKSSRRILTPQKKR